MELRADDGAFQSLVFCSVSVLPGLFLKSLGAGNELVGLASIFALPIAFRFLAGIAVDRRGSLRAWSLITQLLSTATALAAAGSMLAGAPLGFTLSLFGLAGLIAAFQDVSTDGLFFHAHAGGIARPPADSAHSGGCARIAESGGSLSCFADFRTINLGVA